MKTGMLGDVPFEVTDKTCRTIRNLSRSNKANYSTHKLVAKKGILEYTGVDPEVISFEVYYSAWLGSNPETWRKKLVKLLEKGKALTFVLGSADPLFTNGKPFTSTFWLKATDMFIYTSLILIIGCLAGVIVNRLRN